MSRYKQSKKTKAFYKSAAWLKCRKLVLKRDYYLCQPCLRDGKLTTADAVHHIKPLEDYPELALDMDNLESICNSCHNKEHPEKGGGSKKEPVREHKARVLKAKANKEVW